MNANHINTPTEIHPNDEDIAQVADGTASEWLREMILEHADCCERCRFVIAELARIADELGELKLPDEISKPLKLDVFTICPSCGKRVSASGSNCPECGENLGIPQPEQAPAKQGKREPRPWRRQGDTTFFWVAGCFFILSLIFTQYSIQLLIACGFFGILAIVDYSQRNVFAPLVKAWREGDEDKAAEVIEDLKERFKVG